MSLRCLLLVTVALFVFCSVLTDADATNQVSNRLGGVHTNVNDDKMNRDFNSAVGTMGSDDEERGGTPSIGKLKTLFQKFLALGKAKTQNILDGNKMKAAMKDPEIAKLTNAAGKVELTNRNIKRVRSFVARNPEERLTLYEKLVLLTVGGMVIGGFGTLIAMTPELLRGD